MSHVGTYLRREGLRSFLSNVIYVYRYWMYRYFQGHSKPSSNISAEIPETGPLFSIVTPCYRSNPAWLLQCIESVLNQSYARWQLCLGLCEVEHDTRKKIEKLAESDSRLQIVDIRENLGISENSNLIAGLASGDYVGFLDHDDFLDCHALAHMAHAINDSGFDIVYSDEERVSERGDPIYFPLIKPDWAPETFLSYNYFCHFTCLRLSLFKQLGGLRKEFDGAQDYDLYLRAVEVTKAIGHIRRVLYSWRVCANSSASGVARSKPYAVTSCIAAMRDHFRRTNIAATVEHGVYDGSLRTRPVVAPFPQIDIFILSGGNVSSIGKCLRSISSRKYPFRVSIHIVTVALPEKVLRELSLSDPNIGVERSPNSTGLIASLNRTALCSKAEFLVFMHDKTLVLHDSWLENLIELATLENIGATGGMLVTNKGRIHSAGLALDSHRMTLNINKGRKHSGFGFANWAQINLNVSTLDGGCLCTRREVFSAVGGFDENCSLLFYDLDFCLKLRILGKRLIYTPFTVCQYSGRLTGHRHKRRMRLLRQKWFQELEHDPYFNFDYFWKPSSLLFFPLKIPSFLRANWKLLWALLAGSRSPHLE